MAHLVSLLLAVFGLIERVAGYFAKQQLINAGKAEQKAETQAGVLHNVEEAHKAVVNPDVERTQRLRHRFDQNLYGNE